MSPSTSTHPAIAPDAAYPLAALDAALRAAALAEPVVEATGGRQWLLLPPGFSAQAQHDPHALPPHVIATVACHDRESIAAYVNRFADGRSILFADYGTAPVITAILDWHCADLQAQPGRHRAVMHLLPSEEFARWSAMEGRVVPQAEFASFLEENVNDVTQPAAGHMLEIARDLEATQNSTFRSRVRLDNGDHGLIYETETKVRGDVVVPRSFHLSIPLWQGEAGQDVECLFRWRIRDGALVLGFEWRRVEYVRRACFREMAVLLAEATGRPLIFGSPG